MMCWPARSRPAGVAFTVTCLALALFASTAFATFPGANGRILFERFLPRYALFTMAPDGSDVHQLQPHPRFDPNYDLEQAASWSANGRWIVYTCYPRSAVYVGVCMMRSDGSDGRQVPGSFTEALQPSFSPGGGRIVYDEFPMHGSPGYIDVINTDGSDFHRRKPGACCAEWAPNGKHIAYNIYMTDPGTWGIWLMRPDGSHARLLYSGGGSPTYTPDGSILFVDDNGHTMLMGGGGANPHPIDIEPIENEAQVAPAGGCVVGTAGEPNTPDLYARGPRCPASGRLIKNALYPRWQPIP
jgi:Tol biopolymer transport system component